MELAEVMLVEPVALLPMIQETLVLLAVAVVGLEEDLLLVVNRVEEVELDTAEQEEQVMRDITEQEVQQVELMAPKAIRLFTAVQEVVAVEQPTSALVFMLVAQEKKEDQE
jgi:hypothetical protein